MKNLFTRILKSHSKTVPEIIQNKLLQQFPDAMNIEWEVKKESYEAIFYLDDIEHIAHLTTDGELDEYKKNLWPAELSDDIASQCLKMGEIMNAIEIIRQKKHYFEIIVRDNDHRRKLLFFNESGTLLKTSE